MSKATGIIVAAVLIIFAGGGGFYGGMQYQKGQSPSFAQAGFQGGGAMPGGGTGMGQNGNRQRQGGGPVSGQIVSKDDSSITVKLTDGSTKIVMLSSKASIGKFTTVKMSDIKQGEQITAFGTSNSDGSVTASMIQIGRPAGMNGNRGFNGNGNPGGNGNTNSGGNAQQQ
jgi:hypothetical protein